MSGDAIANIVAAYRLSYPNAPHEALVRGAEWTVRMGAMSAQESERHANLSHEEQQKLLEEAMFGPGDHSAQRVTPPPGAAPLGA